MERARVALHEGLLAVFAAVLLAMHQPVHAGEPASPGTEQLSGVPIAISYDAARQRLVGTSGALGSANHEVRAAELQAGALRTLRRPVVTVSAQLVEYQKTFTLDLAPAREPFANAVTQLAEGLPGQFPPEYGDILAQVTGRIEQAVPGLIASLPDSLQFRTRDTVLRPTLQAALPIYTGGAIPAVQRGAAAGVELARARQGSAQSLAEVSLVRAYFGQQLAAQLLASSVETRDALDRHLRDARIMEQEGVLAHSRVLQVEVARNAAQRAVERAELEKRSAADALSRLLAVEGPVRPTTALFVNSGPLEPLEAFQSGGGDRPQVRAAAAGRELAGAGVDLARSRFRPQAFGFAEYNLDRHEALPTDPDWVVGVGVRYTILSNIDRGKTLAAAREREMAAAETEREARRTVATETVRAYNLVEAARRSFLLLDANIAAARENLRVQQISFSAGESPVSDLLTAEAALATARSERVAAAYEYDLALAALLAASNRSGEFDRYIARADKILAP